MINNTEQAVAGGYESRSWLCMLRPHGRGRHHIVSCGHERTCLFQIVQRITNPCALHLQPEIHYTSALFIQITVTGRSCQCHHLAELRSCLRQPPHNQRSCFSVGVLIRDASNSKRRRKVASMRAKSRIRLCHSACRREGRGWWQSREVSMLLRSLQKMEDP